MQLISFKYFGMTFFVIHVLCMMEGKVFSMLPGDTAEQSNTGAYSANRERGLASGKHPRDSISPSSSPDEVRESSRYSVSSSALSDEAEKPPLKRSKISNPADEQKSIADEIKEFIRNLVKEPGSFEKTKSDIERSVNSFKRISSNEGVVGGSNPINPYEIIAGYLLPEYLLVPYLPDYNVDWKSVPRLQYTMAILASHYPIAAYHFIELIDVWVNIFSSQLTVLESQEEVEKTGGSEGYASLLHHQNDLKTVMQQLERWKDYLITKFPENHNMELIFQSSLYQGIITQWIEVNVTKDLNQLREGSQRLATDSNFAPAYIKLGDFEDQKTTSIEDYILAIEKGDHYGWVALGRLLETMSLRDFDKLFPNINQQNLLASFSLDFSHKAAELIGSDSNLKHFIDRLEISSQQKLTAYFYLAAGKAGISKGYYDLSKFLEPSLVIEPNFTHRNQLYELMWVKEGDPFGMSIIAAQENSSVAYERIGDWGGNLETSFDQKDPERYGQALDQAKEFFRKIEMLLSME